MLVLTQPLCPLLSPIGETEETNNKVITSTATTTTTATTHEPLSERPSVNTSDQTKRSNSQEGEILKYELSDQDMELVELSASHNLSPNRQTTHRELPVDVPDSFVG